MTTGSIAAARRHAAIVLAAGCLLASPAFAQDVPAASGAGAREGPMHEGPAASSAARPPASPAAPSPKRTKSFAELDANHDGRLSRDEVAGDATWTADFDAADADHNGLLSKSEFAQQAKRRRR